MATCRLGAGRTGFQWTATVRELSQQALNLILPRQFSPGCVLTVKLHHDPERILLTAQVRVSLVRIDAGSWIHSCQFLQKLADRDLQQLLT